MPARAFVIIIEDYSKGNYLPSLPGCNKDAETFIRWLLDSKGVEPGSILCCAGKGFKWRTAGTTSAQILKELAKLQKWADKTDEFYFYFSGHGFSYSEEAWKKSVDVLVASDFADLATGGRACLKLDEIKTKLWKSLGPKHHYYFIDACRNPIASDQISLSGTGLGFPGSQLGTPTIYRLFSTAQGSVAKTQSGFTPLLVKGLSGGGRAKGVRAARMYVVFDLLCDYMKKNLQPKGQDIDYEREGSGEGYILELNPIPKTKCEINVLNAKPDDDFTLVVSNIAGLEKKQQFKGGSFEISLLPDDYFLEVKHPTAAVVRREPPPADPVDFYDPCVARFELQPSPATESAAKKASREASKDGSDAAAATTEVGIPQPSGRTRGLDSGGDDQPTGFDGATKGGDFGFHPGQGMRGLLDAPGRRDEAVLETAAQPQASLASLRVKSTPSPDTEVEVQNLKTGEIRRSAGDFKEAVAPGEYVVKLRERGVTVSRQQLTVKPGETKAVELLARPSDKIRQTILKAVGAEDVAGAAVFSERSLAPLANADLALWLSLFGASRIVGEAGQFQKLERLRLESFADVKKDESVVYVLAGFEKSEGQFGVGLSTGAQVEWETLREVKGLYKIYERRLSAAPGSRLLSLKIPRQPPYTVAVHCLPNRATFVVLAEDKDGRLNFHQFLLPIRQLFKHLDPTVRGYLNRNMLGLVRTITLAQSVFARKRSVQEYLKSTDATVWNDLVGHKWLDPLLALVAAYDVIRHGTIEQASELLRLVNSNLRKYFEGMGDIEAIAKLTGTQWKLPAAAPLLLDGVLAFDDQQEAQILPLAPDKLDYASAWTTWRGAVNDFEPPAGDDSRQSVVSAKTKSVKRSPKKAKGASKKRAAQKRRG